LKNYFCHLFNICPVNDVRQRKMLAAEPLIADPSYFEVEIAY
jgi:hypothetical protein